MIAVALTALLAATSATPPAVEVSGQAFARQGCTIEFRGEARLVRGEQTYSADRLDLVSERLNDGSCGETQTAVLTGAVEIVHSDGVRIRGRQPVVLALRTGELSTEGPLTVESAKSD